MFSNIKNSLLRTPKGASRGFNNIAKADISSADISSAGIKQPEQAQINKPRKWLTNRIKRFYTGGFDK